MSSIWVIDALILLTIISLHVAMVGAAPINASPINATEPPKISPPPPPSYVEEARNTTSLDCPQFLTNRWASCCDIQRNMTDTSGNSTTNITSGVYSLDHYGPFSATYGYCDLQTDGGGWLVIFRRQGLFDFSRGLQQYEDGFGSLEEGNSFWYGLKALGHLTNRSIWELRVDLSTEDSKVHAHYTSFSIGDTSQGYQLTLGPYLEDKSTASDSLQEYNGNMFYTEDNDGPEQNSQCSRNAGGGWWYTSGQCGGLRGGVLTARHENLRGWYNSKVGVILYEKVELKIRQTTCIL